MTTIDDLRHEHGNDMVEQNLTLFKYSRSKTKIEMILLLTTMLDTYEVEYLIRLLNNRLKPKEIPNA